MVGTPTRRAIILLSPLHLLLLGFNINAETTVTRCSDFPYSSV